MLFNSWEFLCFFAVFLIFFCITRRNSRLLVILTASYVFYGWWDWRFLLLIVLITGISYGTGLLIADSASEKVRRVSLWCSVGSCLFILGFFKYFNFFVESLCEIFGFSSNQWILSIILPVGVSFYTFQSLSYTIDVYRKRLDAERSILRFATYISFFPHVVAGPIVRAADFLPELKVDPALEWNRIRSGFRIVLIGFFLKCGIADSLATVVDPCFARPEVQSSFATLVGVVFYAFQIYCDFNGYSLIAIGIARMLGYTFLPNFDRPYFSASFSEFWSRWHISLSSWLKDYVYIPLGGNRSGSFNTIRNLMITMLLGGLWHGASWNFVVWGGLHGLYLVGQRQLTPNFAWTESNVFIKSISRTICVLFVFGLTCLAWVFFRSPSFEVAARILQNIFIYDGSSFSSVGGKFYVVKGTLMIAGLIVVELLSFRIPFVKWLEKRPAMDIVLMSITLIAIAFLGTFGSSSFIYFQF